MGRKPKLCPHGIVGIEKCRECRQEYDRAYYQNHPSKRERHREGYMSKYVKQYYRNNKRKLIDLMGGKCVKCGLMPHDVDNCQNVFVVDELIKIEEIQYHKKFTNLSKKDLELAKKLFLEGKTQLLCANCNCIKTWKSNDYSNKKI